MNDDDIEQDEPVTYLTIANIFVHLYLYAIVVLIIDLPRDLLIKYFLIFMVIPALAFMTYVLVTN